MSIEQSLVGTRLLQSPHEPKSNDTGFGRMGAHIGFTPRGIAYGHLKEMGMTNRDQMMLCINAVAQQLERDEPYRAMEEACKHLDYTGACRLVAVLLCERNDA